jgi:hypothetical protein
MKNQIRLACLFLGCLTVTQVARAEKPVFETSTVAAYGGPVGVGFFDTKFKPVRLPTGLLAQRFSLPRYANIGLQLELVPQSGVGASLVFNVAGSESWKWNLVAGGFMRGWGKQMSVPDLPRKWDVNGGTSVEIRAHGDNGWLTVEYRVFLPDLGLMQQMNSIYERCVLDAAKEGQLWLGYKHTW